MHRVAVIGAGAAGLAALRHLADKPDLYTAVCYEQADEVGGQWVYREETGHDDKGRYIFSSMFDACTTDLPKELLQYTGFPFSLDVHSSVPHVDVRQYLERFADHYQLKKYIHFNTLVTKVTPFSKEDGGVKWEIKIRTASGETNDQELTEMFDKVFVCTGAYSFPLIPNIAGKESFRGKLIHSHDYRVPHPYKDMRVVVLGSGPSAQGISVDVAKVAKEVIISHRNKRMNLPFPPNIRQTAAVERLTENSAIFQDGEEYELDALILCTGFRRNYPFLSSECHVKCEGMGVYPLYKHVLHTEYPSLAIIGIMEIIMAPPHAEIQVKFAMSAWEGVQKLPSREDMEADIRRDQEWRLSLGYPAHRPHFLALLARGYENELARLGQFPPYPENKYDAWEMIVDFYLAGYSEYMTISALPRTATGDIDMQQLATFPAYVEKLRSGKIEKNAPFFK